MNASSADRYGFRHFLRLGWPFLIVIATAPGATAGDSPGVKVLKERIADNYPHLRQLYEHIHTHPELSLHEEQTSQRLAQEMRAAGLDVTEHVGGHGIVAILKNGAGPTILVRTDMDALPVTEKTGLPYASKIRVRDATGREVGVMHACGHDMHMSCWIGTARVLAGLKDRWNGTLVFIGQPAEEIGTGARLMLEDGLYRRFPKPNYAIALHCDSDAPTGQVRYTPGQALANVDSVDITVRGKGGHGAAPHATVDPIVLAARIVLDLQTIVSREMNPTDPTVVTVGSIHGGTKHNIIPDEVKMQVTVRTMKDSQRQHVLKAIARICKAAAMGARAPEPIVKVDDSQYTPSVFNDPALTNRLMTAFRRVLGADHVHERPPVMGGEDFSRYHQGGVPICIFWLGAVAPERVEQAQRTGQPLPSLHSDRFYPVPETTMKTGILALTTAVLDLAGK
ncbi:MAG TPA: amidohydrolase [Gemmataceae bacterium]|nr:amidohydrolase [Gemmataceae bacterium]